MARRRCQVVLSPDEGGTSQVTVPGLPECISWGRTEAEALRSAEEAITCCIEARRELGESIPGPVRRSPKVRTVEVAA